MQNARVLNKTSRRTHRIFRKIFDKRAVSNTISATILTGVVISLSLAVYSWSESRSRVYSKEYSETVDAETARLKEKLVCEYVSYENPSDEITAYLLNCGTIDDVEIKSVYISSDTLLLTFSTPTLYYLDGTPIPDQVLDVGEEGYFVLPLSTSLSSGYYNVKIVTERGATFSAKFVV